VRSRSRLSAAYRKAEELATRKNAAPVELAEALWEAEQREPGGLRSLSESTGLGLRRAYYLLGIWDRFAHLHMPKWLLVDVGWTKLALVAKHSPPGMERSWLDLAQRNTVKELETAFLHGGQRDGPKAHSILLRLTPSQYKVFSAVLPKYGAKPPKKGKGLVNKELALTRALRELL
jgi:hypothetical protein